MNTRGKAKLLITLQSSFPDFPSEIRVSPEDNRTLWVMVFDVPDNQVRAVKDFIHAMGDQMPECKDTILLPMVKDINTTMEHYPEHCHGKATDTAELKDPSLGQTFHGGSMILGDSGKTGVEGEDDLAWVSWGDCMQWHLSCIQKGIRDLYGEGAASDLEKDKNGVFFFRYDGRADLKKVGEKIGVRHSGPSISSSSRSRQPPGETSRRSRQFRQVRKAGRVS